MTQQSDRPADTLADTLLWFQRAVPMPTSKSKAAQLGCHFEEVAEMIDTLQAYDGLTNQLLAEAHNALENLATHLKSFSTDVLLFPTDPKDLLDSICDQIVTATGFAHMMGYRVVEGLQTVNTSNWSKFVDGQPLFDDNGKIQKGPNYFKADLSPYIPNP